MQTDTQAAPVPTPAEGTDHVCDNCGCEIMVKHSGDHAKHTSDSYTCRCGTLMRLEHEADSGTALSV